LRESERKFRERGAETEVNKNFPPRRESNPPQDKIDQDDISNDRESRQCVGQVEEPRNLVHVKTATLIFGLLNWKGTERGVHGRR